MLCSSMLKKGYQNTIIVSYVICHVEDHDDIFQWQLRGFVVEITREFFLVCWPSVWSLSVLWVDWCSFLIAVKRNSIQQWWSCDVVEDNDDHNEVIDDINGWTSVNGWRYKLSIDLNFS